MPKQVRSSIDRSHMPAGLQGQILTVDPSSPRGMSWRWPEIKEMRDLPGMHPGLSPAGKSDGAWQEIGGSGLAFDTATAGNWSVGSAGTEEAPAYRVDPMGMVQFKGAIEKTTASTQAFGSPLFTMPTGYGWYGEDGTNVVSFSVYSTDAAGAPHLAHVALWSDGTAFPNQLRYTGTHDTSITTLNLHQLTWLMDSVI